MVLRLILCSGSDVLSDGGNPYFDFIPGSVTRFTLV